MMVLEKRLCPSAKINHTVSCNISLYGDTKEVIYRYTQNVYRCISSTYIMYIYRIACNFQGRKCLRLTSIKAFCELNFKDCL